MRTVGVAATQSNLNGVDEEALAAAEVVTHRFGIWCKNVRAAVNLTSESVEYQTGPHRYMYVYITPRPGTLIS